MSLESSESEILPGETASGANEISTANSSKNLTPSSFEDVVPSESPNAAAAAVNAESDANAATPTLVPSDATAAPTAAADTAAPTASKKPRSEKQAAADAGAKKILDEVLIPRYATEFADISEKFRPKAKPLVARKLYYTANSAEKERIIKNVIAKDREAAQIRENGKTRKNRNRTAAKEAKAAASLAAKEAKAAEMAAARAANPTAPRTRRLKAALNAAAEMGAANSALGAANSTAAVGATTRKKKTVGFSNNGMTATAAARARLDAKMLEKFGSEADKMKEKLNKVAGTVEAKLAQTGRQVAEELRKIAERFSETSSKYSTTRKANNTAGTGLTASRSSRKKNSTAAAAAAAENAGLSAIPEGEESNATPENTSKPESEYFG